MEEDSNEPMSLADRLKQKGSPVDVIKNGRAEAKEKKPRAPRGKDFSSIFGSLLRKFSCLAERISESRFWGSFKF